MKIAHYEPRTTPYEHQRATLEEMWDAEGWGFIFEMGTGKSKTTVDNICMLREVGGLTKVLIVAPKGTYETWSEKQIPEHMPERHLSTTFVHLWRGGGSPREQRDLSRIMGVRDYMCILVMNIEALSMSTKAQRTVDEFMRHGRVMVVVDESSTIKNPQAIRTKRLLKIGRAAAWRRILTGTPATRSPLDMWSQMEFVEPGCLGFRSYYAFRARFAIVEKKHFGGRSVDIVVGHRDTDVLASRVADHATIIRKEDCLDLPPKVYETRYVEMTEEQERLYADLKKYATAEIEAGTFVTTTQVITQILRLHQILCGHVVNEQGGVTDVPTRRLDALEELIEETSGQNIVWCSYRRDVDKVVERLTRMGRRVVRYDGSTSQVDRALAVDLFQEGKVDDFVGTPHAGGYGLTLTKARTVIYYSNSYDLEKRLQSEDRAHRIGQTGSVLYVDLMVRGTVEERIVEALHRKQTLASIIMDGPARVREFIG